MSKITETERLERKAQLLEILKPGDTVSCILRHVSQSGMTRVISLLAVKDNKTYDLDYLASPLVDCRIDQKHGGLRIGGYGMDMGFALVYNLSRELFRDNFICIGENCPANDHSNGDKDRTPHKHSDGGYALRMNWL